MEGIEVCQQHRVPGKPPRFTPRGVKISECQPYVERLLDTGPILICEGPTDAIASGSVAQLSHYSIIGCWSASTLPPADWWISRGITRSRLVVTCGDNDPAGKTFNQRVANVLGSCYQLHWPSFFPQKGDVGDWLTQRSPETFLAIIDISVAKGPIKRSEGRTGPSQSKRNYKERPGLISRLIEEAGGRLAFRMAEGSVKYFCPLHDDQEDASLTANDRTGMWMCWSGCGKGNVPQWLMAWKGCSYEESIELVRKYV